jgi:hypothetical protein
MRATATTRWASLWYDGAVPLLGAILTFFIMLWIRTGNDPALQVSPRALLVPLVAGAISGASIYLTSNIVELAWNILWAGVRNERDDALMEVQISERTASDLRAETSHWQEQAAAAVATLDHYRNSLPHIVVQSCYEDPWTTPWYVQRPDGSVEHRADSYFTHVHFVNRPTFPSAESRAENVAALVTVFVDDLVVAAEWPGRWANTPENPPQRDPRPQRRVDIDPDGQLVSLDITIRNPAAYSVFGYNDDSRMHDRGFDESKALPPGEYIVRVTLQGIRMPITNYWFDLVIGQPSDAVRISQKSTASAADRV